MYKNDIMYILASTFGGIIHVNNVYQEPMKKHLVFQVFFHGLLCIHVQCLCGNASCYIYVYVGMQQATYF